MLRRPKFDCPQTVVAVAVARPFRVMVAQADGGVALFRALPTLSAAFRMAESACHRHRARLRRERMVVLSDPKRPRRVYVEQWIGSAVEGKWVRVPISRGGFQCEFDDKVNVPEKEQLNSGDIVDCVLLPEKTRRGGWRACIAGKSNVGPVTGQSPDGCHPGQTVRLKLCGLSRRTGAAQFAWQA